MTALLVKDWKLLKGQRQFFMVIIGLAAFYAIFMNETAMSFVVTYIAIMMAMFTLSTISYDEYNNGAAFLFTLPIERREYVLEKYVFAAIVTGVSSAVGLGVCCGIGFARGYFASAGDVVEVAVSGLVGGVVVVCLLLALMIPLQLKFGVEKSRMVWIGGIMVVAVLGFGGAKLAQLLDVDVKGIIGVLGQASPVVAGAVLLVILAVGVAVSCVISVKIVEKKEF